MNKIMLLNTSIATLNIGDEIIYSSFLRNMDDIIGDSYTIDFPTHTPPFSWIQSKIKKNKVDIYSNVDYKFIAGTNLLYSSMMRPIPGWNINLSNYQCVKDTILVGVGAGINSKNIDIYTKLLYNKVLSKDVYHSVRDEKAKEMLESIGLKAINTGCVTLWGLTNEVCEKIPTQKANRVVFTLTYYTPDIENDKKLVEILKDNYEEVYFWPQCIEDYNYLLTLGCDNDIKIISPNLKSYTKYLEDTDTDYVGTRLHGGVYAMQHGRRSIILEIDYRLEEMKTTYNLNSIPRKDVTGIEAMINSTLVTKINIDINKVNEWKKQFLKR